MAYIFKLDVQNPCYLVNLKPSKLKHMAHEAHKVNSSQVEYIANFLKALTTIEYHFLPDGAISTSALSIVDDVISIVDDVISSSALNAYDIINKDKG